MKLFEKQWFVMRDLKRRNANTLAVHELSKAGFEVFTPMTQMIINIGGRRQRRDVPVIQDLLFVHETKAALDPYVELHPTLQYRYLLGMSINEPMTVRMEEMNRFIFAVNNSESTVYYKPGELTKAMYGKRIRIVGGVLDSFEGCLLAVKGMRKRRLLIEFPSLITAAVEVQPEFIQLVR